MIVVADWCGALDDGSPFHGSVVRGLDATDPTNIKVLCDAKLVGWTRDLRVVGDVLYAVSEQWRNETYLDAVDRMVVVPFPNPLAPVSGVRSTLLIASVTWVARSRERRTVFTIIVTWTPP